jgi:hypothetical protein
VHSLELSYSLLFTWTLTHIANGCHSSTSITAQPRRANRKHGTPNNTSAPPAGLRVSPSFSHKPSSHCLIAVSSFKMCHYYRKHFTCDHLSAMHRHTCRPAILSGTLCSINDSPPASPSQAAVKSFFPCYDCIRAETIAEAAEANSLATKREEDEKQRAKEKAEQEKREEEAFQQSRKMQAEKAKKSGLWLDVERSGRKKGKKGTAWGGGVTGGMPHSEPPVGGGGNMSKRMGEFTRETEPPKTTTGFEGGGGGGGRAGAWGPKSETGDKKGGGVRESSAWRQ